MTECKEGSITKTALIILIAQNNDRKVYMVNIREYPTKKYLHFDNKIPYNQNCRNYVENPARIVQHSFFPFIKFEIESKKFISHNMNSKPIIKTKIRPILYASHVDGYIYKYYSELLSDLYNEWVKAALFDECVTAYRNNRSGKCNIDFAYDVVEYITKLDDCYILVGDYQHFFDTLDHQYLKDKVLKIISKGKLPDDYYKVFKSITKYSFIDKAKIDQYHKDNNINIKIIAKYFNSIQNFRVFKAKNGVVEHNVNNYGIPQGTALSAVLANIYLIDVDQSINDLVKSYHGIYRRYSDDFIIVVPSNKVNVDQFNDCILKQVYRIIDKSKLKIQDEKTKIYKYTLGKNILNVDTNKFEHLDYLGFCFDGKNVSIRQRSIYKYYRSAYNALNILKMRSIRKGKTSLIGKRKIFILYTDKGKCSNLKYKYGKIKYRGNFISYIKRAQNLFNQNNKINCLIDKQVCNWKKKIYFKCKL